MTWLLQPKVIVLLKLVVISDLVIISDDVPEASSESVQPASACEGGVCQQPEGGRSEPAASLGSAQWRVPSKEIFRSFLEAVTEFSMVKDGDRLLVCLSGGKDSLSLLHCVRQYQFQARKQVGQFIVSQSFIKQLVSSKYKVLLTF